MTQDAVAEALTIASDLAALGGGRQNLTLKTLAHVADVLDVELMNSCKRTVTLATPMSR